MFNILYSDLTYTCSEYNLCFYLLIINFVVKYSLQYIIKGSRI